ncbi:MULTISPECIES: glutamine-hydrolyzing GMP synthase [Planococcus]|uniref:GMP synthase [glutamine-hydrolyzing] n=2 Tax=Planococcus TaxID=1372 RepID=A0ABM5X118_9BACL|nr:MULTISPECIES: glutamine-hydrolyzing GMP synthase [Planococcus]ALS80335.1 GMP synthetase [Planococcus kocurii]AQU80999.1 ribosome biogenesis GTPase Der [Planococcus faecalis]KAA0957081.1 glutamine-hydrolyzing GMP synthase [Planococcus sp. ANT_H30]MDJ0331415.1 glutamine-hydrolyzing GMP synthase [Planococcus sp. S3-L1]OHX53256.1 glutamine-hydrolyzing GMP synthase [Planococcus faecalis]
MLKEQKKIVVLDFGSQYNQLITRRIREIGVYSELHPHTVTAEEIKDMNATGIIFSGGPNSVYDDNAFSIDDAIFEMGLPILGICYGMQLMALHLKGNVEKAQNREYGKAELKLTKESKIFNGLPEEQIVWMSHGDLVTAAPPGFDVIGTSASCPIASMADESRGFYGVQFHPEVRHTMHGNDLLRKFVYDVCGMKDDWSMENYIELEIEKIREEVGDKKVLCALSGGVDSSVVAVLIHRAIGDQLTCMFVDHGLLRKGEAESVMKTFADGFNMNVIKIDARDRFMSKLEGVTDPEKKRKIIGNEFIYVFDDEASKLEGMDFLAQGTLYTDIIESGTTTAQTIKSHHNVGGLPDDMQFKLIEPLNTLFKDEVRVLGAELGMPDEIVWRQPFPGPGLGIRIMGAVTEEKLEIVRESDWILRDEIKKAGLDRDIWQYFTVLPDLRSVGVMGDARTYDYAIGIRAVTSIDGMTSDWARIPWDVLEKISVRLVNEVDHINRVLYDITSKPPATIEWE